MPAYLDSIITEYYDGSDWVDITAYVVGDIKGNNGLGGWRPDQRVAVLGTLNITLNNKGKLFSPMGGDALRGLSTLTGFNKGAKIRIRGLFDDIYHPIWTGRIASIDSDDLNWGNEQVRLMAVDWMNVPVNYPMKGATIALNKRIDEAMTLILARLSLQPEDTDFDTGSFTFPAVFDNVQRKTMALSEFTKLANSELGYIYIKQDGTLRVENFTARQGWRDLDTVWVQPEGDSYLALEDGLGLLLLETGGKIILDEGTTQDAAISADAEKYNILLPEDGLLNASIIRAHPVITDTSLKVLYKLGTPLLIASGQTMDFSAHYTDPSGLSQVSGTNMQTPVATTDYLANTLEDGSGTNKTSDIVVTATYYGDTVYYSIANNANAGVYITLLQARGYGIYYANSIESTKDDAISQARYGYAPFQFDQKYQKDNYLADMYGLSVIEEYKYPKSRITNMKFLANLNKNHMMTFLTLTIGSLLLGTEDRSNISSNYYITDRAFIIKQGGIINVEYGVKQNDSYLSGGLNPITIEFDDPVGVSMAVNFGHLPQITGLTTRSWAGWVYLMESNAFNTVMSNMTLAGSGYFTITTPSGLLRIELGFSGSQALFSTANLIPTNTWKHFVITHDGTTNTPIMYIDGTPRSVTIDTAASGTLNAENKNNFTLGAVAWNNGNSYNGRLHDIRIYNRILTAAEVTTLYNAGTADETLVTDGLMFQGPAEYSDRPFSAGQTLTSADRIVENIFRVIGIPNDSPVIRANP